MDLRRVVEKLPKHPTKVFDRRKIAEITYIVVHHSTGDPLRVTVEGMARYHITEPPNGRGWAAIGYHYAIDMNGVVYETLDQDVVGAHVYGYNQESIGICLIGNFVGGAEPPDAQRRALSELLAWLCPQVSVPLERVKGHKDFPAQNTTCPGDTWSEWGLTAISDARTLIEAAPRMWSEAEIVTLIEKHRA